MVGVLTETIILTGAKRRDFSGMIHWLTINNFLSNPHSHPFPTFKTSKLSDVTPLVPGVFGATL